MIKCSQCGKRFVDAGQFAKHLVDLHTDEAETILNLLEDVKGVDINFFVSQLKACYDACLREHHWKN